MATQLAIVVPCFDEEAALPATCRQLVALLGKLVADGRVSASSRVYFIDDGSGDRTWSVIEGFISDGWPVVGVKLSRNQGHQNALLAGLATAEGDAVISMDADLQDDVAAIGTMLDHFALGCDVVYGVRASRSTDTLFKRWTARLFYRLMQFLGADTLPDHADYRLLSRRAIESLLSFGEANLFLRGIVPLLGYRSAIVRYDRGPRQAGETKYPLRKMVSLSLNAITSFSTVPLRMISAMGILVSIASAFLGLWAFFGALLGGRTIPGWASTVLPIYFLGGIQLMGLGVIGEYVGKIYLETKRRPRYFIETVSRSKN
jgi:glycosyltransferase involved in cell wall biosynthesis